VPQRDVGAKVVGRQLVTSRGAAEGAGEGIEYVLLMLTTCMPTQLAKCINPHN
jgi:hypothetical protein